MKGAGDVDFGVDMGVVLTRFRELDEATRKQAAKELRKGYKGAADVVRKEWANRVPKRTGKFMRGGRAGVDRMGAYVSVVQTVKAPPYAAVVEFGGTIPVPYSRTNPRLRGQRRLASKDKPWIGGRGGGSYYLYPARDAKIQAAADELTSGVQQLVNHYFPDLGAGGSVT